MGTEGVRESLYHTLHALFITSLLRVNVFICEMGTRLASVIDWLKVVFEQISLWKMLGVWFW